MQTITTFVCANELHTRRPRPALIEIADIAHALSMLCRFCGHVPAFYSVAQHSVLVSGLLCDWNTSPELQLAGLLHDAAEAYLGDLITPVKRRCLEYRQLETIWQQAIARRFGLPPAIFEAAEVRKADRLMLEREQWWRTGRHRRFPQPLEPERARQQFLEWFKILSLELKGAM